MGISCSPPDILAARGFVCRSGMPTTFKPIRELKTAGNLVAWNAGEPVFSPDSRRVLMLRTDQDEKLVTIWDLDDAKGRDMSSFAAIRASTRRLSVATENAW